MPPRRARRAAIAPPESEPPLPSLALASQPAGTSQEGFDLSDAGDASESGSNESAHSDHKHGVNDPDAIATKSKSRAVDVWFFFYKDARGHVCRVCENLKKEDPSNFDKKIFWTFSVHTSTTSLRPYIEKYHLEQYLLEATKNKWKIQLPGLLSQARAQAASAESSGSRVRQDQFSEQTFHQHLVNFIVANDRAMNIMECPEFRKLLLLLRSDLQDSQIPHRTKMHELILQSWSQHFQVLRRDLAAAVGRISFTLDTWSDQNYRNYLAITAHWIAEVKGTSALQLKAALISFHRLRQNHTGKSMARVVVHLLDRAGITAKAGHFTMDNASNNGTMMERLEKILKEREIAFDANDRKIMCFAHIINLCSGRVVRAASNGSEVVDNLSKDDSEDEDVPIASDPIAQARTVVRVIRGSGACRDAFQDVIDRGNKDGWFKEGKKVIKVPVLQLLRDVRTRWDSVYMMLERLRSMRQAVDHFLALPNHSDLKKYKISSPSWDTMQDIEFVLNVPHVVQQIMSNERTPILCGAIPAFEMFMSTWEMITKGCKSSVTTYAQAGLECAYKYYARMDRTQAYIIAMLLHPTIRMTWIHKHWDADYIADAEEKIHKLMSDYYENAENAENAAACNDESLVPENARTPGEEAYVKLAAKYGIGKDMIIGNRGKYKKPAREEYQAYVKAPCSPSDVDPLKFWELNRSSFPTLFAMAMDYLPIQASSVPCERVFSSSAETDTKRRNRLSPLTMEALQMLKFHLKKVRLSFTEGWMTSEKELVDDDPDVELTSLLDGNFQDGLDKVVNCINTSELS